MDGLVGRVFGSCLRSFWWQENETARNKSIDYIPNRKWRYKDENLMKQLNDHSSWDIMDLTDDEYMDSHIGSNGKLRLHDIPVPANNNYANDSNGTEEICLNDQEEVVNTEQHKPVTLLACSHERLDVVDKEGLIETNTIEVTHHTVIIHRHETEEIAEEAEEIAEEVTEKLEEDKEDEAMICAEGNNVGS